MKWRKPETAPKDMSAFLAQFDSHASTVVAMWNGVSGNWIGAAPQISLFQGRWEDTYFENEAFGECDLARWMPLPASPRQGSKA